VNGVDLTVRPRFHRYVSGRGSGEGVWSSLATAESGLLRTPSAGPAQSPCARGRRPPVPRVGEHQLL
jgi:hypothetical protein